MKTILTDAGRVSSGYGWETKDCTVRALVAATGWGYWWAHRFARYCGRPDCFGHPWNLIATHAGMISLPQYGGRYVCHFDGSRYGARYRTRQLLKILPRRGVFAIATETHVFVMADGVLFDRVPVFMDRPVVEVWKYCGKKRGSLRPRRSSECRHGTW